MTPTDEEIVAAGTRRAVGRVALRRLSSLVRDWQAEEAARAALAKRLALGITLAALLAFALFNWFYR